MNSMAKFSNLEIIKKIETTIRTRRYRPKFNYDSSSLNQGSSLDTGKVGDSPERNIKDANIPNIIISESSELSNDDDKSE